MAPQIWLSLLWYELQFHKAQQLWLRNIFLQSFLLLCCNLILSWFTNLGDQFEIVFIVKIIPEYIKLEVSFGIETFSIEIVQQQDIS